MKHRVRGLALIAAGFLAGALAAPRAQAASDISDEAIQQFVDSYAAPAPASGRMARWKGIACPETYGLEAPVGALVTKRVKEVAALVGAGAKAKPTCGMNIRILFTPEPQKLLDQIREQSPDDLGYVVPSQINEAATMRHPIQAWYVTATEDLKGKATRDSARVGRGGECGGGGVQAGACTSASAGSLIRTSPSSVLDGITVIVDAKVFSGATIEEVADYIAMVALSQTASFGECRDLPSITNLTSANCDAAKKAKTLTVGDIAYLRALYKIDLRVEAPVQQRSLVTSMKKELTGR